MEPYNRTEKTITEFAILKKLFERYYTIEYAKTVFKSICEIFNLSGSIETSQYVLTIYNNYSHRFDYGEKFITYEEFEDYMFRD